MVRDYETMYIIKPTLDEEAIDVVTKRVDDQITALGTLEKTEKRGRKRLAYDWGRIAVGTEKERKKKRKGKKPGWD